MESDLSGIFPGLTEQQRLNPEPRKSRFIEHFDQDTNTEHVLYVISEEQESIHSSSIPTSKPTSWIRSKCGKLLPKKSLAPTKEAPKACDSTNKNGHDNSQAKPGKSFSDKISLAKTKIRQIVSPLTRRQQPYMTVTICGDDLTLYRLPRQTTIPSAERIHYLRRVQMEAALKDLAVQDANVDAGKTTMTTTTKIVSEMVTTLDSQSPSRLTSSTEIARWVESLPVTASPVMLNQSPIDQPLAGIPSTPAEGTHEVS